MAGDWSPFGQTALWVMWIETILAAIFVALRVYTRMVLVKSFGWDDHLTWISLALFITYSCFITVAVSQGYGKHATDILAPQDPTRAVFYVLLGQVCNITAIFTTKSSVAVFLLRLVVEKSHRFMLHACIWTTAVVCFSCIILMYTQCTPVSFIWDPTIAGGVCHFNFAIDAIFSGSYTVLMDFVLAGLPWLVLWNVQMRRKERLTISIGLSLGVFAGIFGIARAVLLANVGALTDYTYATVNIMILGSTELLVCMVCATLPGLRPLWSRIKGGSTNDKNSKGINYAYPSRGYDELGKETGADMKLDTFKDYNGATATATAAGDPHLESRMPADRGAEDDSASDEQKLVIQSPFAIMRTTEVDVTYASAGKSASRGSD